MTPVASALAAARRQAGRIKRRISPPPYRPGLPDPSWVATVAPPDAVDLLPDVRLFAILGTWLEADVVGATVRNARTQGCERVLLVDNDSADSTVAEAIAAGAELHTSFSTDEYDEAQRIRIMNDAVAEVSRAVHEADGDEHLWWLWLDADEFPHGPGGATVLEHVRSLDRRYRIVGARFLNHYPDRRPCSIVDHHPVDLQPLCEEQVYPMCEAGHRKHPLQRWDAAGPPITCGAGFHMASSDERPLAEPPAPVITHHFPYRNEHLTRARLDALCATRARQGDEAVAHINARSRSLDAVYAQRWSDVENFLPGQPDTGVHLVPWTRLVAPDDAELARWYEPEFVDERR